MIVAGGIAGDVNHALKQILADSFWISLTHLPQFRFAVPLKAAEFLA
jgi:hypothetical protein